MKYNQECKEFNKFVELLKEKKIDFELNFDDLDRNQVIIPNVEAWKKDLTDAARWISIIWLKGSFGYNEGLLEVWSPGRMEDAVGYLTAEQAVSLIQELLDDKLYEKSLLIY